MNKTKVMIFRKGGANKRNLSFTYSGVVIELVKQFTYLGVVFTTGGSFSETHDALSGQALKAIYKLKSYVNKFTDLSVSHMLDLFDKLILPILNYGSEVRGFTKAEIIERVHLQFCKHLLGIKTQTQNNYIYGELGRLPVRNRRLFNIIRYWFKILQCDDTKYIKLTYIMMLNDVHRFPDKPSWAKLVKTMLENFGFSHVRLSHGVGNINAFMSIFKQRKTDNFVQNWSEKLENN